MTDHDDPESAEPALSAADEAEISGLLRTLPAVHMPPDLADRIDQAMAAEAVSRGTASAATVVAIRPDEFGRAGSRKRFWTTAPVRIAAAVVVVLAAGGVFAVFRSSGSGGSGAAALPPVTHSDFDYTSANLDAQVVSLTGGKHSAGEQTTGSSGSDQASTTGGIVQPAASASPDSRAAAPTVSGKAGLASASTLTSCLKTWSSGHTPVALDAGYFDGQPALVIVLRSASHAFAVYVVDAHCPAGLDNGLLLYRVVTAS